MPHNCIQRTINVSILKVLPNAKPPVYSHAVSLRNPLTAIMSGRSFIHSSPATIHIPIPSTTFQPLLKVIRPALLLRPKFLIVSSRMNFQLDLIRIHNLLATVLALHHPRGQTQSQSQSFFINSHPVLKFSLTMEVGFGAFTGRPFALTGARVPAASAFLCSLVR